MARAFLSQEMVGNEDGGIDGASEWLGEGHSGR